MMLKEYMRAHGKICVRHIDKHIFCFQTSNWSAVKKLWLLLVERCSCELFTLVLTDMSCIVFLCPDVNKMSKSNQLELSIFGKWRITCLKKVNSFLFASNSALKYLVLCFGWWGCSNKVKVIQLKICVHLTKFTYGHLDMGHLFFWPPYPMKIVTWKRVTKSTEGCHPSTLPKEWQMKILV